MTSLTNSTPIAYRKTGSQTVKINTKENLRSKMRLKSSRQNLVNWPCKWPCEWVTFFGRKPHLFKRSSSAFVRLQGHSFFLPKIASKFFGRKNTIFAKGLLPHLCGYKVIRFFFRAPQMGFYKVKWSFFSAANGSL